MFCGLIFFSLFFFCPFLSLPLTLPHGLRMLLVYRSRRWWRTGKPGVLQSMGSQRVRQDWATEQQLAYREHHPIFGLREEGRLLFIPELWGPLSHLWTLASGWTSPGCCSGLWSWDVWEVLSQAAASLPLPLRYLDFWKKYGEDQLTSVIRVVEECQVHALRLCSFPSCELLRFGEMTLR